MKIGSTAENVLLTNNTGPSGKFKIEATGKAFHILSSSLYSHKVKAVVREIGCNAYDAHIMAGNTEVPFDVHLPTVEDPRFRVRDYGVGLSMDTFVDVYTTYFGSNKANSNDFTGGLGLGSKTPFILSKTFTVNSFFNGVVYMWQAFTNDNGEPDVLLLAERPTDEPNGLEVIVPVGANLTAYEKTSLYKEFLSEAHTIYSWFDTMPNVMQGDGAIEIKHALTPTKKNNLNSIEIPGVDRTIVHYVDQEMSRNIQRSSIINVKMGNVVYPFDLKANVKNYEKFGGNASKAENAIDFISRYSNLNDCGLFTIDFSMGAVDMAPSREALSLTNTTELTIVNAIVVFVNQYSKRIQDRINAAATPAEAYSAFFKLPLPTGVEFTYKGKTLRADQQGKWIFHSSTVATIPKGLRHINKDGLRMRVKSPHRVAMKTMTDDLYSLGAYGPYENEYVMVLVDVNYKGNIRFWIEKNVKRSNTTNVIVISGASDSSKTIPLTDAQMAPFLEDGNPCVVKFSSFTNVPKEAKSAGTTAIDDGEVMGFSSYITNSTANPFTTGNMKMVPSSYITHQLADGVTHPLNARLGAAIINPVLLLCKVGDSIQSEVSLLAKQTDVDAKVVLAEVAPFSRSTRASVPQTSRHVLIPTIMSTLLLLADRPNPPGFDETKFEYNGRSYVFNPHRAIPVGVRKDQFNQFSDPVQYPHVFTVDRFITTFILPYVKETIETHVLKEEFDDEVLDLDDNDVAMNTWLAGDVANTKGFPYKLFSHFGINEIAKHTSEIKGKIRDSRQSNLTSVASSKLLSGNFSVGKGYASYYRALKGEVNRITHIYTLDNTILYEALKKSGTQLGDLLYQWMSGMPDAGEEFIRASNREGWRHSPQSYPGEKEILMALSLYGMPSVDDQQKIVDAFKAEVTQHYKKIVT